MAHRLGAVFSFVHRGGHAATHWLCGSRQERRCPCSSSSSSSSSSMVLMVVVVWLTGSRQQGEEYTVSLGMELVSWAQIQLLGPPPAAHWRVVVTLSPRASLAALLCRPMGKPAVEILTAVIYVRKLGGRYVLSVSHRRSRVITHQRQCLCLLVGFFCFSVCHFVASLFLSLSHDFSCLLSFMHEHRQTHSQWFE